MASRKFQRPGRANATGRNKHTSFIMIRNDIYRSPAYQELSNVAARIFIEIRRRFNGFNNGEITLSYREAAKVAHCGLDTARRGIQKLIEHGLIKIVKRGIFSTRMATTWALTHETVNGNAPTNEWRAWQPAQEQNEVSRMERLGLLKIYIQKRVYILETVLKEHLVKLRLFIFPLFKIERTF